MEIDLRIIESDSKMAVARIEAKKKDLEFLRRLKVHRERLKVLKEREERYGEKLSQNNAQLSIHHFDLSLLCPPSSPRPITPLLPELPLGFQIRVG